jgi:pimeloyl-ACP methyl ester carboxylesterase
MTQTPGNAADRLQSIPFDQLATEIEAGMHAEDLKAVFGEALTAEIQSMAGSQGAMMGADRPLVILLPGIMGSTLDNTVGQSGRIWVDIPTLMLGRITLLMLDEQAQPLTPGTRIQATDLYRSVYLLMRLQFGWVGGCDVYTLPFDWRYPPAAAAEQLRELVNKLRATTRRRVHLVGHSMGGLVARAYCTVYADEAIRHIAQVIMLGTPNAGSVDAIRNLTIGGDQIRMISRLTLSRAVYDFARSIPGIYALLPVPPEGYAARNHAYPYAFEFDPFCAEDYRVAGVSPVRLAEARAVLAVPPQELPVPVTIIAGTGVETARGARLIESPDERATFDFSDTTLEGDGTVLVASAAALPGATIRYVWEGRHGDLPLYPNVRRAVLDLIRGTNPRDLSQQIDRGFMDEPAKAEQRGVPATPPPGTLSSDDIDRAAGRIRDGSATPEDYALLARGW